MGRLTTHVLDSAHGRPAADVAIQLTRIDGAQRTPLAAARTNADGRCDAPMLEGDAFTAGVYELTFDAGAYFRALGVDLAEPAFLDSVVIRIGIADADAHYHVPLLLSPYAYSTYRGS